MTEHDITIQAPEALCAPLPSEIPAPATLSDNELAAVSGGMTRKVNEYEGQH
ncbi:bacteriocin [Microvirga antarctica]|uniref:bacteriocin n=1 Tax=Microvirga antarctica TaxID=2819233 RepID=UPI001B316172|nr:bacteriocin [Microvirga antarctica]